MIRPCMHRHLVDSQRRPKNLKPGGGGGTRGILSITPARSQKAGGESDEKFSKRITRCATFDETLSTQINRPLVKHYQEYRYDETLSKQITGPWPYGPLGPCYLLG